MFFTSPLLLDTNFHILHPDMKRQRKREGERRIERGGEDSNGLSSAIISRESKGIELERSEMVIG